MKATSMIITIFRPNFLNISFYREFADLLGMLRVVDKDTLIIRRDILRTICDLLFINPALKDDFRECGGFASILSALTSLSGCKFNTPPSPVRANQS